MFQASCSQRPSVCFLPLVLRDQISLPYKEIGKIYLCWLVGSVCFCFAVLVHRLRIPTVL
jgi:hypothetical protein